jgi:DNA-binding MarR family transcriptional regulator
MSPDLENAAPARVSTLITWRISRLSQRAHRLLAGRLAAEGFSGHQYRLLAALAEAGAASQAELGRRTGLDRSDVTGGIDVLVDRDLVERTADPDDRRRNIITLTPAGTAALETLDDIVTAVQDELLTGLSETDRRHFDRLLDQLLES